MTVDRNTVLRDTVLRTCGHVLIRGIEDRLMVLHIASEQYFGLDEVGARVWRLLEQGPTTPADLARTLTTEFDVDEATLLADLEPLLQSMVERGLVEIG